MKYSLYKELVNQDSILSHLFLNCMTKENLGKIVDEHKDWPKEKIDAREIEIEVKINGVSVNPKKFFDLFNDQHEGMVKREATKILKAQIGGKFSEIAAKLYEFERITDIWADEIKWNGDNLLLKKEVAKPAGLKLNRSTKYQSIMSVLRSIRALKSGDKFRLASIDGYYSAKFVRYDKKVLYYTVVTSNPVVSATRIKKVALHRIKFIRDAAANKK